MLSCKTDEARRGSVPVMYEEMIQKLEKDIRQHIAFENQMRIHIENLSNKAEDNESVVADLKKEHEEDLRLLKREKRRLDDLLTIREDEVQSLKAINNELVLRNEQMEAEYNKKIEKLESKYESHL